MLYLPESVCKEVQTDHNEESLGKLLPFSHCNVTLIIRSSEATPLEASMLVSQTPTYFTSSTHVPVSGETGLMKFCEWLRQGGVDWGDTCDFRVIPKSKSPFLFFFRTLSDLRVKWDRGTWTWD